MVRNYIKKKEKSCSKEKLLEVLELVKSKMLNSYEAAKTFNIPRSTIVSHLYGTRGQKKVNPGIKTVFSIDVEPKIASYLHTLEKYGFPLAKKRSQNISITIRRKKRMNNSI
ncbi:hypothetical protein PYW08_006459 [Mythimna loreyi]|uniref:Uncharacterized protein n=1 Tax=Mythimna loreyi TaxID=667449 RepID=A0ACC2QPP6_9NEOP|nr:hypothetical protein PYW08_006459 [Mythimna loreyi]